MQEKLLNIKEVAEYLKLPEDEVKGLVSDGEIPAYKIGGLVLRFKKEQVEHYRGKKASGSKGGSPIYADRLKEHIAPSEERRKVRGGRRVFKREGEAVSYSFIERLEDFLYYNDFYILSLILLAVVMFAIFEL